MADVEGVEMTVAAMTAMQQQMLPYAAAALFQEGEGIVAVSKGEFVPVDSGTLRGTGHVQPPEVVGSVATVTLGFGGPAARYALSVHENPRSGKTGGRSPSGKPYRSWATVGQWKYLETPVKMATAGMASRIAGRIFGSFGGTVS